MVFKSVLLVILLAFAIESARPDGDNNYYAQIYKNIDICEGEPEIMVCDGSCHPIPEKTSIRAIGPTYYINVSTFKREDCLDETGSLPFGRGCTTFVTTSRAIKCYPE